MAGPPQKVEFALGSKVSEGHFFKSDYARSVATSSGRISDTRSLDLSNTHPPIAEEPGEASVLPSINFSSLNNFDNKTEERIPSISSESTTFPSPDSLRVDVPLSTVIELQELRKKVQLLSAENWRLKNNSTTESTNPESEKEDRHYQLNTLRIQVSTLQWQLIQAERSRRMYRSVMGEVTRFLERARTSFELIHERSQKQCTKSKLRVLRSRSEHAVNVDSTGASSSCTESTNSSTSSSSSSPLLSFKQRFCRAKSIAQMSGVSGKDTAWTSLKRNDPVECIPTKMANESAGFYKKPRPRVDLDPNDQPPEKLAREATRLIQMMGSLIVTQEPDLAKVDSSTTGQHSNGNPMLSLPVGIGCSTTRQSAFTDNKEQQIAQMSTFDKVIMTLPVEAKESLHPAAVEFLRTQDLSQVNLATTLLELAQQENPLPLFISDGSDRTAPESSIPVNPTPVTSTPISAASKKNDQPKETSISCPNWALADSTDQLTVRPKPTISVSSAEDESGFSSLSSFQEIGLPTTSRMQVTVPNKLSLTKGGCHTEVGLPEVPIENVHRRWSSTPGEIKVLVKRHSGSFINDRPTKSVWV